MRPKVSVIILNWNGWKDTIECSESVFRNTYPNYQVIIVDNGSTDGSMEKIKKWAEGKQEVLTPEPTHPLYHLSHPPVKKPIPYIYYTREETEKGGNFKLEEKLTKECQRYRKLYSKKLNSTSPYPLIFIQTGDNLGFAGGNNVGIRFTIKQGADYILVLNNDTVVKPRFIEELIKCYDKKTGIHAPIVFNYYNPSKIHSSGGEFSIVKGTYSTSIKKIKNNIKETSFIPGCCWLIKNEIFKKFGLIDEKYFLYSEDVDFCYRLKQAGYKLKVIPSSVIFHNKIKETMGNISPLKLYYFHRSKLMFINTNYKGLKKIYYNYLNIIFRYIRVFEYFIRGRKDISKSIWRALKDYNK